MAGNFSLKFSGKIITKKIQNIGKSLTISYDLDMHHYIFAIIALHGNSFLAR